MIREDLLLTIGPINRSETDITLNGFGGSTVRALSKLKCDIGVDDYDETYKCDVHVAPNNIDISEDYYRSRIFKLRQSSN